MITKLQTAIDKLKKQKNFEIYRINSKAPLIRKGEKTSGNYYHVCPGCLRFLNFIQFRPYKIGWLAKDKSRRHARCRKCESDRQKNKRNERPAKRLWLVRRRYSLKNKIPFDITIEDIENIWPKDNKCPITKKIFRSGIENKFDLPTLDKIIPAKGYVKGNIAVISFQANSLKGPIVDFSIFERMAKFYKRLN